MNAWRVIRLTAAALLVAATDAAAQGDFAVGRQLAQSDGCLSCHTIDQTAGDDRDAPYLAGQKLDYLIKQITFFRQEQRNAPMGPTSVNARAHPIMGSRVAPLSDREIEHIATYFSLLPCTYRRFAANPAARAPALAQRCAFCHGPEGANLYADAPNLAGQKMEYLMRQLGKLRRSAIGIVTTDTAERFHRTMAPAVYDLTDTDIAQIANYFSSQSCRGTN